MMKVIVSLLISFFVVSNAGATYLLNGDFDDYGIESRWAVFSDLPGWRTVEGPGIEVDKSGVVVDAHSGDQYIELDSHANTTMAQDVYLDSGEYSLSFWYQPRTDWGNNSNDIFYAINGIFSETVGGIKSQYDGWSLQELSFKVLKDDTYSLLFGALGKSDSYGGFLDSISLVKVGGKYPSDVAPVPEPATLILLGFGFVGFVFFRRMKRC